MNPTQCPKDTRSARFSPGMRSISCGMTIRATLFFLAALLFFASGVWARPTTVDEARNVAVNWLRLETRPMGSPLGHEIEKVETFTDEAGDPAYYVVHLLPSGLIFLSADDLVEPIIGFVSDATSYDPAPTNPLAALVSRDIPGRVAYVRKKEAALQNGETPAADSPMAKAQNKWARLSGTDGSGDVTGPTSSSPSDPPSTISDVRVSPFVQSKWNQTDIGGGGACPVVACYNYYTPPNSSGDRGNYYCGCVATAMAQVMRYFKYPAAGVGTATGYYEIDGVGDYQAPLLGGNGNGGPYDWTNMPLTPDCTTTVSQSQAIGALTWDAGISVDMNYSSSGSSANPLKIPTALTGIFHYSNAIYSDSTTWANTYVLQPNDPLYTMVNPNLYAGYPVLLGIYATGASDGHEIVCDGYGLNIINGTTTMYHHLNMGWSGDDDAWYNLPTIDPTDTTGYNTITSCIYNIYKKINTSSDIGEIISGRVLDANNAPIAGATVIATAGGITYPAMQNDVLAFTTSTGVYAIPRVPSNETFTVSASKPGYTFSSIQVTTGTSTSTTPGNFWGALIYGAIQTGSLTVTISPPAAVSAGAMWSYDGGASWNASGVPVSLALGPYTVSFNTISGWTSPASQAVNIVSGQNPPLTCTYVPQQLQVGSLSVTITPQGAIDSGAQWNVNGGAWQPSGSTVPNLSVGTYTVSFRPVSGWNTPGTQPAIIQNGQTTSLAGLYTQQTGSLTVTISPAAAVSAGAMWNVDGGGWQASGATVGNLSVGSHTVNYNSIIGWSSPASQTVSIVNGQTTSWTGTYVQKGSLTVTISPTEAVNAGALWTFDDGDPWLRSGTMVMDLIPGAHTVSFNTITGWNTPVNQTANITSGQTISLTATYIQQTGSLAVAISPAAAVSAGAMWKVDSGAWQVSGTTVSPLSVGQHTVSFNAIASWTSPANQTVNIVKGQTTSASGLYVQQTGSLTVNISPAAAVSAGAMWSIDGGTWQASGSSVPYIPVGSHTVGFRGIAYWNTPSIQTVNIENGQTASAAGTYTPFYSASLTASTTGGKAPLAVHFTYTSTSSVTKCLWNFGDGTMSKVPYPNHTYRKAGTYTVTLTVTGFLGTYTCTQPDYITVYAAPTANFIASPSSGKAPLQVNFTDESTGLVTSRLWHFGDGATSTDQSPEHTYNKPGTYTAKLTVTGPGGSSSRALSIRATK